MTGPLGAAVQRVLPSVRADLERLVRIPSVSADPAAAPHLRESSRTVARPLREAGLPEVDVLTAGDGQSAVLGRRPGPPGAPTVLLYAHHDVQPAGDRPSWDSDPFEPTERDGRLYGRGAADDKAGIAVHLAALRVHGDRLPVGVTVLVEGEEEIGSPTLPEFLDAYRDRLRADVVVFAHAANWTTDVPSLTTTLRGGINLRAQAPWGVHVTVQAAGAAAPYTARTGGPAYAVMHAALARAWGRPAVDIGAGGSIPFVTAYARAVPEAEILITGVEDPDTRAHGANESLHLATFERACLAEALLLRNLAPRAGHR